MSSWLFTTLFGLLMGAAIVLMLAILVGLCMDGTRGVSHAKIAWPTMRLLFCPVDVRERIRKLH